jgi:uncharacterized protein (DUF2164 family)
MAGITPERDEGLGNLEGFCALLAAARAEVASAESALQIQAQALHDGAAVVGARQRSLSEHLTAWDESFQAAFQSTLAELLALTQGASALADERLVEAQATLHGAEQAFTAGLASSGEGLARADASTRAELAAMETETESLEAPVDELATAGQEVSSDLTAALASASDDVESVGRDVASALEETDLHLAEALSAYLDASFDLMVGHLETEVAPVLNETLGDLFGKLRDRHDDFAAALVRASDDLVDELSRRFLDAVHEAEAQARDHQEAARDAEDDALLPLVEETERSLSAMNEGAETASALGTLLPTLGQVRDVAHQVDDMLDVLNPFD